MENSYRAGMNTLCPSCGWPRRYHAGHRADGRLIPAPDICAGFRAEKPKVITTVHVVYVPKTVRAA